MPSIFGERPVCDVDTSTFFSQGVLAAFTLVKGERGARAGTGVRQDLPSVQWPSLPYWGWGLIPWCWSRSSKDWVWADSVPFKCVLFHLPAALGPLLWRRGVLKQVGPVWALSLCQLQPEFWCAACAGAQGSTLMQPWVQVPFVPHSWSLSSAPAALPVMASLLRAGGSCVVFWCVLGVSCFVTTAIRDLGCVSKHQQWMPQPHPGSPLGPGNLCVPWSSLFLCLGHLRSSPALWSGVSAAGEFALLRPGHIEMVAGNLAAIEQTSLCPVSWARLYVRAPHEQSPGFPQSFVQSQRSSNQPRRLISPA